ncbi:MAG: TatD family hydrolase [Eubacteriales bacterium]|nr:TatD family hydrolase [Eubacteriales bacterium]
MLIDAHLHITQRDVEDGILNIMDEMDYYGLTAGTNPPDCAWIASLAQRQKHIIPTFGLHPWYADQYELKDMMIYLQSCSIIGEIGMDSVWCYTDLDTQRKVFLAQMDIAQERGCPVILHTKGQEKEIGEIISDYSIPIIIHWYSSQKYLDLYLKRDCYFTVGPDVLKNKAVQHVVKDVALNRLFVETDGTNAIEWAIGRAVSPRKLPEILLRSIDCISNLKGIDADIVQKEIRKNIKVFDLFNP